MRSWDGEPALLPELAAIKAGVAGFAAWPGPAELAAEIVEDLPRANVACPYNAAGLDDADAVDPFEELDRHLDALGARGEA